VTFDLFNTHRCVVADYPGDTQPGLNSSGITLELGGLWDPNFPRQSRLRPAHSARSPQPISQCFRDVNGSRGGVIASPPDITLTTILREPL